VKYCYFEQYGQCAKGDACPFAHRSQEQCWYEANGGCRRGDACLFKHTGIKPANDTAVTGSEANENKTTDSLPMSNEQATTSAPAAKQPTVVTAPVVPAVNKTVTPSLNTSLLEEKLNSVKKSTPADAVSSHIGLNVNARTPEAKPAIAIKHPGAAQSPKAAETGLGIQLKGSAAKLAVASAAKANATLANAGKPMSSLRAAALASLKPGMANAKSPDAKPAVKRGESPAAAIKPTNQQVKGPGAVKQPTPHGSPNLNNKQAAANKTNAKSPAGTGNGGLDNIKILTFEEIMAQKRAKKEAEQAAAAATEIPKTRALPKRAQTPTAKPASPATAPKLTTEKQNTISPTSAAAPEPSQPKSVPAAVSSSANSTSSDKPPVAKANKAPVAKPVEPNPVEVTPKPLQVKPTEPTPAKAVPSEPGLTDVNNNTPANGSNHIGVKRPAEPSELGQPTAKKPAGEQLSVSESISKVSNTPPAPAPQKRPLEAEEVLSNKKPALEKKESTFDELAQFEAEFGELDDLEAGDIKDFDEESIMKELEELENV